MEDFLRGSEVLVKVSEALWGFHGVTGALQRFDVRLRVFGNISGGFGEF